MKSLLLFIGFLSVISVARQQNLKTQNFLKNDVQKNEWKIIFEDTFDGKDIDQSKWNFAYNYTHTNNEQQIYFPKNAYIEDGNLVIKTQFEPTFYYPTNRTYNFTSAWLDTSKKFNFTSGTKMEAKILLPKTKKGDQIWPAFWTIGESAQWPDGGEIDVMEMNTNWNSDQLPHLCGTYHWGVNGKDYCGGCGTIFPDYTIDLTKWITFSAIWEESQITWTTVQNQIYNNTVVHKPVDLPKYPQFIILNNAIDGNGVPDPSEYPKYMKIDYVRVYQKDEVTSQ